MPLAANLRDTWDYTTKCTGPHSLEHSFSASSSQHTALAHIPNGLSCQPAELHRGTPVIWDQVLEAGTAGTAVLHRSSVCGTVGSQSQAQAWSNYKVWDTSLLLGTKLCSLPWPQNRHVYEFQKQGWDSEADLKILDKDQLDLRLEKSKFWIREATGNTPNSIPFLQTYKEGS